MPKSNPVPAILEYLPYRKRDGTVERDQLTHPYFAGHGYACVRVDMRGCGESDGVLGGRIQPSSELDDGVEVINWLAEPGLVYRQGRHDGDLVGRLQRPADRRHAA